MVSFLYSEVNQFETMISYGYQHVKALRFVLTLTSRQEREITEKDGEKDGSIW